MDYSSAESDDNRDKKRKKRRQMDYSDEDESESDSGPAIKKRKITEKLRRKIKPMKIASKYNYIPSCVSLKTTDESVIYNLLQTVNSAQINVKPKLDSTIASQNHHGRDQILAKIKNIFSNNECAEIISESEALNSFQNLNASNKYNERIRKSDRLLVLDDKLSSLLWKRLNNVIKHDIIETNNISTTPLGFSVLHNMADSKQQNEWDVSSINIAMRINKYDSNNDDFFTYHKDAQYCPSADERSIFTLIIYLNDDFEGGETKFYFNKNNNNNNNHPNQTILSACTIDEEIEHFGGIDDGYECRKIQPSIGDGVIFSQDILHEGCRIRTPNKYKYLLKTDIVVKRKTKTGFAISSEESIGYQRCLNYFTQAQREELGNNQDKANELYERSLSIRYSYPNKLLQNANVNKTQVDLELEMNIDEIWLILFDYCHIREMEYISYLFPKQLYHLLTAWKIIYAQRTRNVEEDKGFNDIDTLSVPFIPKVISQHGCYHTFEFNDYDFFVENEDDCCRVAAMYAFALMSHVKNTKYFIAQYDSLTQRVMAVPLSKLLKDIFYNRQCNGSYFKIKKQNDDILKCFNDNVDRDFMSIVYGSQFVGGTGLISDKQYGYDLSVAVGTNCYCDVSELIPSSISDIEEDFVEKWNDYLTTKGWPDNDQVHKTKYINDLIEMKNNKQFACSKTQLLQHRNHYKNDDYSIDEVEDEWIDAVKYRQNYNHLIFDFSKHRLEVNKNKKILSGRECKNCLSLDLERVIHKHMIQESLDYPSLKYYTINIKSLFKNGEFSLAFNHASCNCDSHEVRVGAEINSDLYFGYNHTYHIHITSIKTNDNKLRMWISYNGISAM